jgi:hypothetical protein
LLLSGHRGWILRSTGTLEGLLLVRREVPSLLRKPSALEPIAVTSSLRVVMIGTRVGVVPRWPLIAATHQLANQACNALKCRVYVAKRTLETLFVSLLLDCSLILVLLLVEFSELPWLEVGNLQRIPVEQLSMSLILSSLSRVSIVETHKGCSSWSDLHRSYFPEGLEEGDQISLVHGSKVVSLDMKAQVLHGLLEGESLALLIQLPLLLGLSLAHVESSRIILTESLQSHLGFLEAHKAKAL